VDVPGSVRVFVGVTVSVGVGVGVGRITPPDSTEPMSQAAPLGRPAPR
jgi:hypothetical protein